MDHTSILVACITASELRAANITSFDPKGSVNTFADTVGIDSAGADRGGVRRFRWRGSRLPARCQQAAPLPASMRRVQGRARAKALKPRASARRG